MEKIRLRTKIEIIGALTFIMLIVIVSVTALNRTITDTSDTIDTYIRNSNGKYWSVSEANIQAAIDDLGVSGWKSGIVWVAGNREIVINTGIVLRKYVTLDLQGSYLDVRSNVYGVTMAEGSTLRGGTIDTRNYVGTYTKAAVAFDPSVSGYNYWTGNTIVQNMYLQGAEGEGAGIQLQCGTQSNIISFTQCENIQIYQFKYSILINVTGGSNSGAPTYANGNTFNNIRLIYPTYGIYLNRNTLVTYNQCGNDGNMFNNIITQTGTNTQRIIYAEGRYNIFDNIFVWDWSSAPGAYAYEFTSDSYQTFLTFFGAENYYMNYGSDNYRLNMRYGQYAIASYNQATEPDIPNDTMAFWKNTVNNKFYIIQDFNGTQKKAELI